MFFGKEYYDRENNLRKELPDDIYLPYNSGRRVGMGRDVQVKTIGDFTAQPLPYEVSLRAWIGHMFGIGGFSGAKTTYTLIPDVKVTSFGTDVTMVRNTGTVSITTPVTNRLEALQITGTSSDISGSGTFTIAVDLGDPLLNNDYDSMYRPNSFEVWDESNEINGGPTTTNSFVLDDSVNTVQKEIVGVSGGILTLRVSNLQVYEKWTIVLAF